MEKIQKSFKCNGFGNLFSFTCFCLASKIKFGSLSHDRILWRQQTQEALV